MEVSAILTCLLFFGSVHAESSVVLKCYKCGFQETDEYCPSSKSLWKKEDCRSIAKLGNDEALACFQTTFEDRTESKLLRSI